MTDAIQESIEQGTDTIDWTQIDSYVSGSGSVRTYEGTDELGRIWQKGIHDFDSDFNPIIFLEIVG
jgi:hypothetical protein